MQGQLNRDLLCIQIVRLPPRDAPESSIGQFKLCSKWAGHSFRWHFVGQSTRSSQAISIRGCGKVPPTGLLSVQLPGNLITISFFVQLCNGQEGVVITSL